VLDAKAARENRTVDMFKDPTRFEEVFDRKTDVSNAVGLSEEWAMVADGPCAGGLASVLLHVAAIWAALCKVVVAS